MVEYAQAANSSLVSIYGSASAVESEMLAVFNAVATKYSESSIDIQYKLVETYVSTSTNTNIGEGYTDWYSLNDQFVAWGNSGGFSNTFDVANLWTDQNSAAYVGASYVGSICTSNRYSTCKWNSTWYQHNFAERWSLLAHEQGHAWGAYHTNTKGDIMYSTLYDVNVNWDAVTISSITTYKASASCLSSCGNTTPAPVADFSSSLSAPCSGKVNFTDLSTNAPTSWLWNFGDGGTSSAQNPSHTYTTAGKYTVSLKATNAGGSDTEQKINHVTIAFATPPTTSDGYSCGPGIVTMSATSTNGGGLEWYDQPTGGSLVNTGSTYSPNLSVSDTFYVQEVAGATSDHMGPADETSLGASASNNSNYGMFFDALTDFTLNSVLVHADGAANRTIEILSGGATGTVAYTKTVNIPDGTSRVNLGFNIVAGNNYFIHCNNTTYAANMYRNNAVPGGTYPITLPGVASITGSNVAGSELLYYYFFYDWDVSWAGGCSSTRSMVVANVGCVGSEEFSDARVSVYPNPVKQGLYVRIENGTVQEGQVQIVDVLGRVIREQSFSSARERLSFDISTEPDGVYFVKVLNGDKYSMTRVVKVQ